MTHALFSSDQLDGIAAAAIVARWLRLHGKDWHVGGIITKADTQAAAKIINSANTHIHLLDIHPQQLAPLDDFLQKLPNKITYWCSDMPCKEEVAQKVKAATIASDIITQKSALCSAELARLRFLPHDATAEMLASLARDIKLWQRKDETAIRLADAVASGYDKKGIVDMLSKGVLWSAALEVARNEYLRKRDNALEELKKNFTIKDYVGVKFGFALAANLLPSADACQRILDMHVAVGVAVVIYRDGRVAFRRREGVDVNLEALAHLFDGGGREYASGGRLRNVSSISGENFEKTVFGVDRVLKDFFLQ